MPRSCPGAFPGKEGGIQVLVGLAPSNQIVGSIVKKPWPEKPAGKIGQNVSWMNSLEWKNAPNNF